MEFYSQSGEDKYLWENYFKHNTGGSFVDIGAHDGISGNNTYFFERLGWNGVCYEPAPKIFERLKQNRYCVCENIAISDEISTNKEFIYIDGHSEMLSGLLEDFTHEHVSRIQKESAEHVNMMDTIRVETSTFNEEVLFTHVNILSIDTEGSEGKIIRSIDFDKYDIKFMIIEFNQPDPDLHQYILSKGYTQDARMGVNIIFKKIK